MLQTERMPDLVEVMRMGKDHRLKHRQLPLLVDENLTVSLGFPPPTTRSSRAEDGISLHNMSPNYYNLYYTIYMYKYIEFPKHFDCFVVSRYKIYLPNILMFSFFYNYCLLSIFIFCSKFTCIIDHYLSFFFFY